jgi:hypothetical protein
MGSILYEERLFSRWMTLTLGAVTLFILWRVMQQLQGGVPVDDSPSWLLPLMLVVFVLVTVNFAWLTIRITDEEAVIAYGVIRHRIRLEEIEDCYADTASAIRYGGFGIRRGWYNGMHRLIYNTIGDPRVVLLTTDSSTPEFVFSTTQPERVMDLVREHLRILKR